MNSAGTGPDPQDMHEWISFEDDEEQRTWMFDVTFLLSRWTCIFGRGCQGILEEPIPNRLDGCCTHGAHFVDDQDLDRVANCASELSDDQWQFASIGRRKGISVKLRDGSQRTRVHDGACIMLNRPGFHAGAGCALHQAAIAAERSYMDFKPDVCWQLPLRLVDSTDDNGHVTSTLREWKRRDWGDGGQEFHWWCTEAEEAFTASTTVLATMKEEIIGLVGRRPYEQLVEALTQRLTTSTPLLHPTVRPRS